MQQHSTVPGCTEQLAFSLGINCGSNPKKLFLHPSNVSRHVRKPVYQPAGKTKTHFLSFAVDLVSILFLYTLSHIQNSFFSSNQLPHQGVHFFPTPLSSPLAHSSLFYKLRKGAARITASLSAWPVCAFHTLWPTQESCKIFLSPRPLW